MAEAVKISDPEPSPRKREEMRRVRNKNTTPEKIVRSIAFGMGLRFRLHRRDLPGSPDIVFPKYRIALFVHGCFWHRHEGCSRATIPKTRRAFWTKKLLANVERDARAQEELCDQGWKPLVIWSCELRDPTTVRRRLFRAVQRTK